MPLHNLPQTHPLVFYTLAGLGGLIIGSFLNVVVYRLPKILDREWRRECRSLLKLEPPPGEKPELGLMGPRSRCPNCNHQISALENVPVVSYVFLRGKCSACQAPISLRYPAVELLTALLTLTVAWRFGYGLQAPFALLLTWSLIALSAIDLDCQLLPDDITLPFLWLGLLCNLFGLFTDVTSSLVGAIAGYVLLWVVYTLFKFMTGKEGMGYGDFKLLAMLGAWLGWQMLPLIVLASSICGALVGIGLMVIRDRPRSQPIPFGPYLAAAGWIALLWGPQLTGAYLRWTGAV